MWTHIVSLVDRVAQTVVVWNNDIKSLSRYRQANGRCLIGQLLQG